MKSPRMKYWLLPLLLLVMLGIGASDSPQIRVEVDVPQALALGDTITIDTTTYMESILILSIPTTTTITDPSGRIISLEVIPYSGGLYRSTYAPETEGTYIVNSTVTMDTRQVSTIKEVVVSDSSVLFLLDVERQGSDLIGNVIIQDGIDPIATSVDLFGSNEEEAIYEHLCTIDCTGYCDVACVADEEISKILAIANVSGKEVQTRIDLDSVEVGTNEAVVLVNISENISGMVYGKRLIQMNAVGGEDTTWILEVESEGNVSIVLGDYVKSIAAEENSSTVIENSTIHISTENRSRQNITYTREALPIHLNRSLQKVEVNVEALYTVENLSILIQENITTESFALYRIENDSYTIASNEYLFTNNATLWLSIPYVEENVSYVVLEEEVLGVQGSGLEQGVWHLEVSVGDEVRILPEIAGDINVTCGGSQVLDTNTTYNTSACDVVHITAPESTEIIFISGEEILVVERPDLQIQDMITIVQEEITDGYNYTILVHDLLEQNITNISVHQVLPDDSRVIQEMNRSLVTNTTDMQAYKLDFYVTFVDNYTRHYYMEQEITLPSFDLSVEPELEISFKEEVEEVIPEDASFITKLISTAQAEENVNFSIEVEDDDSTFIKRAIGEDRKRDDVNVTETDVDLEENTLLKSETEGLFVQRTRKEFTQGTIIEDTDLTFNVKVNKRTDVKPGVYKLTTSSIANGITINKTTWFAWGLVSINSLKPMYHPGEEADFRLVVLDEKGFTVSNAHIDVVMTSPSGKTKNFSTEDYTIGDTSDRGVYRMVTYLDEEGVYHFKATSKLNGRAFSIETTVQTADYYEYDILRSVPSTIDPWQGPYTNTFSFKDYNMPENFDVVEILPPSFEVTDSGDAQVLYTDEFVQLRWFNVHVDDEITYSAQTPLITPYLFELGNAYIEYEKDGESALFFENRTWMLAIDPLPAPSPFLRMEWNNTVITTEQWIVINMSQEYRDPIVVASPEYTATTIDRGIGAWITNVTSTNFSIRAVDSNFAATDTIHVHYMVMEAGSWTLPGTSQRVEAGQVNTTGIGFSGGNYGCPGFGTTVSFTNSFASNPLVLHSRASDFTHNTFALSFVNDGSTTGQVGTDDMCVGMSRSRAGTASIPNGEYVNYIAVDEGHGTIEGIEYEVKWTLDDTGDSGGSWINGYDDGIPFVDSYATAFSTLPNTTIVGQTSTQGGDGSWAVLYDQTSLSQIRMFVDETDERSHGASESGGGWAFNESGSYDGNAAPQIYNPQFNQSIVIRNNSVLFNVTAEDPNGNDTITSVNATFQYPNGTKVNITLNRLTLFANASSGDLEASENDTKGSSAQNDWLDGWTHRVEHLLNGSTSADVTNYQVEYRIYNISGTNGVGNSIYLNLSDKGNYSDLRITNSLGTASGLLDYWIDFNNSDNESATVWVEVDSIMYPNNTIFFYYGNTSNISVSNATDTWELFENFDLYKSNLGTVPPNWRDTGSGDIRLRAVGSGLGARKENNNDPQGGARPFRRNLSNFYVQFVNNRNAATGGAQDRFAISDQGGTGYGPRMSATNGGANTFGVEERAATASSGDVFAGTASPSAATYYLWTYWKNGTTLNATIATTAGVTLESIQGTDGTYTGQDVDSFYVHGGNQFTWDNITVRNFILPEPEPDNSSAPSTRAGDVDTSFEYQYYYDVISGAMQNISNISVTINVSAWNNAGSTFNGNDAPDIEIELATANNGSYVSIGTINPSGPGFYVNYTNLSAITTAWRTEAFRDLRVRAVNIDFGDASNIDEINYTDVIVNISFATITSSFSYVWNDTNQTGTYNVTDIYAIDEDGKLNHSTFHNVTFDSYSYANLTNISIESLTPYFVALNTSFSCAAVDHFNSSAAIGVNISFYENASFIGSAFTNGSGVANVTYKPTSVGEKNISCEITNTSAPAYYLSPQWQNSTHILVNISAVKAHLIDLVNGTIVDRENVSAAHIDTVTINASTRYDFANQTLSFMANLTTPDKGVPYREIELGTNTTNVTGHATFVWDPSVLRYAGNYTLYVESDNTTTNNSKYLHLYGVLNVSFKWNASFPNASYITEQVVRLLTNVTSRGPENGSDFNETYNVSLEAWLNKTSLTRVINGTYFNATGLTGFYNSSYLLKISDPIGNWSVTRLKVNASFMFDNYTFHERNFTHIGTTNITLLDGREVGIPQENTSCAHYHFYANFTNSTGEPALGASCQINMSGNMQNIMTYDSTLRIYNFTRFFPFARAEYWNVTCTQPIYETQIGLNDSLIAQYVNITHAASIVPLPTLDSYQYNTTITDNRGCMVNATQTRFYPHNHTELDIHPAENSSVWVSGEYDGNATRSDELLNSTSVAYNTNVSYTKDYRVLDFILGGGLWH